MDWQTFRSSPHLVLAAAIVIAALVIGGVVLKVHSDNKCKPIYTGAGFDRGWQTPPGC